MKKIDVDNLFLGYISEDILSVNDPYIEWNWVQNIAILTFYLEFSYRVRLPALEHQFHHHGNYQCVGVIAFTQWM